jgi:hypothetical protein
MRYLRGFILFVTALVFGHGCGKCEKLNLTDNEKGWVNHFQPGQYFFFGPKY